jgi:hypothetical protein
MCLTQRVRRRSADLGGDTGVSPFPHLWRAEGRRRERRAGAQALSASCRFEPLRSSEEGSSDEDRTEQQASRPSQISLGRTWLEGEPSSSARSAPGSTRPSSTTVAPPGGQPPASSLNLSVLEFPPLPSHGERASLSEPSPNRQFSPPVVFIGALAIPLPASGGALAAGDMGAPELGLRLADGAGGDGPVDQRSMGLLGHMGLRLLGLDNTGAQPSSDSSLVDDSHVSLGLGRTVGMDSEGEDRPLDGSSPPPPVLKWLWIRAGTLNPDLGFPAPPCDVR